MGYLQVFGEKLEEILRTRGLTEAQCEDVIAYVKEHVLQSYRNGVDRGRAEDAPQSTKPAPRQKAEAPRSSNRVRGLPVFGSTTPHERAGTPPTREEDRAPTAGAAAHLR